MKLLCLAILLFFMAVPVKYTFAECKEFKVIEYENSTEVVCVGEPLTATEIKEQEQRIDIQSNRQIIIDDSNENKRCSLEEDVCSSRCSVGKSDSVLCRQRCRESLAQCKITILNNSSSNSSDNCNQRCSLEDKVCRSRCEVGKKGTVDCWKKCRESEAQCKISCLY